MVLAIGGFWLVTTLTKSAASMSRMSKGSRTRPSNNISQLAKRIRASSLAFLISFALQACLSVVSVMDNATMSEGANQVIPVLYWSAELAASIILLLLFRAAVASAARQAARAKSHSTEQQSPQRLETSIKASSKACP